MEESANAAVTHDAVDPVYQVEDVINSLMPYCAYKPATPLDKIKKDRNFRYLASKEITSAYRYSSSELLDEKGTFYKTTIYTRTPDRIEYEEHVLSDKGNIVASSYYRPSGFLKLYTRVYDSTTVDYYYYDEAGELVEVSVTTGGNPGYKFFVEEGGIHALVMLVRLNERHEVHLPQQIRGRPAELTIGTLMENATAEYQKLNHIPGSTTETNAAE